MGKAIIIFGGSLSKDKNRVWRTTGFDEKGDRYGILGDRLRVLAAKILYDKNPNQQIIVLGGKGYSAGIKDAPSVSVVIKKELIELGVPEDKILTETTSQNTWTQVAELKRITELKKYEVVEVVSNDYHLPRIKTMIGLDKNLTRRLESTLRLVSAEKILLMHDPKRWLELIKSTYKSKDMQARIKKEKKGIRMLERGKYKIS